MKETNSKLSAAQQISNLPYNARMVYYDLVCNPKHLRTRAETSKHLNIPKSTVYDYADILERCGAIVRYRGMRKDTFYRKGKNHHLVDAYLDRDFKTLKINQKPDDLVVGGRDLPGRIPYVRAHLNGGWCSVKVLREGMIEYYPIIIRNKKVNKALFGRTGKSKGMKGMSCWQNNSIYMGDERGKVRYQKGIKTGSMTFGLIPPSVMLLREEVEAAKGDPNGIFYSTLASFLAELEKYASWLFEKDGDGNYLINIPSRLEYGFDAETSSVLQEMLGEKFGMPGTAPFWDDKSPSADGPDGEFESNEISHTVALLEISDTTALTHVLDSKVEQLQKRMKSAEERLDCLDGGTSE